jgi:hypothetical protein
VSILAQSLSRRSAKNSHNTPFLYPMATPIGCDLYHNPPKKRQKWWFFCNSVCNSAASAANDGFLGLTLADGRHLRYPFALQAAWTRTHRFAHLALDGLAPPQPGDRWVLSLSSGINAQLIQLPRCPQDH